MVSELEALAILTHIRHLGPIRIRLLIQRFGSPQAALDVPHTEVAALPHFGLKIAEQWGNWERDSQWKRDLELADKEGVKLIPYHSPHYPKRLLEIPDSPILLYVRGQVTAVDHSIAVVGTREASAYALEMAERLSEELAKEGFCVVSGLARGIDTAAHRGAIRSGRSVAVLGSGLARVYPQENRKLARLLEQKGAVISEFPMETDPDRKNFPQRNRIVAGMTQGTLFIEGPEESGARQTVKKAFSYRRKVFALRGRGQERECQGNDRLIRGNQAILIENAQDLIRHLECGACIPKPNF